MESTVSSVCPRCIKRSVKFSTGSVSSAMRKHSAIQFNRCDSQPSFTRARSSLTELNSPCEFVQLARKSDKIQRIFAVLVVCFLCMTSTASNTGFHLWFGGRRDWAKRNANVIPIPLLKVFWVTLDEPIRVHFCVLAKLKKCNTM